MSINETEGAAASSSEIQYSKLVSDNYNVESRSKRHLLLIATGCLLLFGTVYYGEQHQKERRAAFRLPFDVSSSNIPDQAKEQNQQSGGSLRNIFNVTLDEAISGMKVSGDGRTVAVSLENDTVVIYSYSPDRRVYIQLGNALRWYDAEYRQMDVSNDGRTIALGFETGVQAFRFDQGRGNWSKLGDKIEHGDYISRVIGLAVSEQGDTLVVNGEEYCSGRLYYIYRYNDTVQGGWEQIGGSIYRHDDEFNDVNPSLSSDGSIVTIVNYNLGIFAIYCLSDNGQWEQQAVESRPWMCDDDCYDFSYDGKNEFVANTADASVVVMGKTNTKSSGNWHDLTEMKVVKYSKIANDWLENVLYFKEIEYLAWTSVSFDGNVGAFSLNQQGGVFSEILIVADRGGTHWTEVASVPMKFNLLSLSHDGSILASGYGSSFSIYTITT